MPGLGVQELAIILVIVLVIFGAGKVPSVMKELGAGLREMKQVTQEIEQTEKELR